jgi:hypothetical protein
MAGFTTAICQRQIQPCDHKGSTVHLISRRSARSVPFTTAWMVPFRAMCVAESRMTQPTHRGTPFDSRRRSLRVEREVNDRIREARPPFRRRSQSDHRVPPTAGTNEPTLCPPTPLWRALDLGQGRDSRHETKADLARPWAGPPSRGLGASGKPPSTR